MIAVRRYGHLLLATLFGLGVLLGAALPVYAADLSGKTVTAVNATGNKQITEDAILQTVKLKPGDTLTADKVKQDMQAIYELGYFYDVVANFTEVPEGVKVVYTVMENPSLKEVVIKGNTKVTTEKINSMITAGKGNILNSKTLNDNMRAIEQYYHDQGYVLARVSDIGMSPEGVLTVAINEGMLEGIEVKGNEKTKKYVITREMKLKTGEPFNAKAARRSMQKVYNLGYFEDVNMKLNPGKEPNAVVLETDVVEQKTGTFTVGGGYSQADGLVGIIEVGDNNFRGIGDKVKLHYEFGGNASDGKNYEISYTRPWLDSKQTSIGFSFYNMTNEYSDYGYQGDNNKLRSTYDRRRKGWDITLGRPAGEYVNNYITYKTREDRHVEYDSGPIDYSDSTGVPWTDGYGKTQNSADWLKDNFGLTNSVTLLRVFDSRDNVYNPSEGSRYSLSAEFGGKMFGGDFDFDKYTAEGRHYIKLGHGAQTLAFKMTAGYATGKLSDANKFAVGGSDTLRGYEDDQFKGDKMLTATAEYRFPIVKKVQGVVFSDIGNAWEGEGYKLSDLKSSAGLGVRVTTPIGPVRIDYAWGQEGGKTHFSFGGQF